MSVPDCSSTGGGSRYANLLARLRRGEKVVIDGATGTEVERRGVPMLPDAWNGGAALSHPEVLQSVHEDYLCSGAEVIITNTFATSMHALADAGQGSHFEEYNRRAVELAIAARSMHSTSDTALVAGGIAYWSFTGQHPPLDVLMRTVAAQASIMAMAGADVIILEMMEDIDRMLATLEGAQQSGLPVWVGLCMGTSKSLEKQPKLMNGRDLLSDAIDAVAAAGNIDVLMIMHTEVDAVDTCLEIVRKHWGGGIHGVYAHSSTWDKLEGQSQGNWLFDNVISPSDYAVAAKRWLAAGAQLVGGCCGTNPDHIARVTECCKEAGRCAGELQEQMMLDKFSEYDLNGGGKMMQGDLTATC